VDIPLFAGVPLMEPLLLSARPVGRDPAETDQLYGVFPPVAESACEYRTPTVAEGGVRVAIRSGWA
jgi:hypothetical protein